MPRFPSVGVQNSGAIARFRSGTSAFTARDADHYTTIAIICWSGWLDTIQRPPASDAGTLPAELHPECRSPAAVACDAGPLLRRQARACETGMRRPWRFHPGRKLAPRSGFEPLSSALTVRCLAVSAIAEYWLTRLDLNQDLTV